MECRSKLNSSQIPLTGSKLSSSTFVTYVSLTSRLMILFVWRSLIVKPPVLKSRNLWETKLWKVCLAARLWSIAQMYLQTFFKFLKHRWENNHNTLLSKIKLGYAPELDEISTLWNLYLTDQKNIINLIIQLKKVENKETLSVAV